jgi:hypothetical protein
MKVRSGITLFALCLTGCNPMSVVDTPSGDAQVLSAARGCFDQGDYVCATKYYGKLSPVAGDTANAESAFELIAQYGATSGIFIKAVLAGGTNGGKLITKLADTLSLNAGQTARLAIFHAYQKAPTISDTKTQGLVRFITALTLTAEILGEAAQTPGKFQTTDLVVAPATCSAASAVFYMVAACNAPTGTKLITGTAAVSLPTATDAQVSGAPTLFLLNAALSEITNGLTQMQASGSLNSASGGFSAATTAIALLVGTDSPTYRGTLLSQGLGTE